MPSVRELRNCIGMRALALCFAVAAICSCVAATAEASCCDTYLGPECCSECCNMGVCVPPRHHICSGVDGCYTRCIFLPTYGRLFPHFLADPRACDMSVGWRFNDKVYCVNHKIRADHLIDISIGHAFPVWRWENYWCCGDALQLEVEANVWGIFDHLGAEAALINTDYFIGIPLSYKRGRWSFRLRGFHVSSHLGDEFLLECPEYPRYNPSAEYVDLFVAYEPWDAARIYWGYGHIVHFDSSFHFERNYIETGFETRLPFFQCHMASQCVIARPYYAMHFRLREDNDYRYDATYVLGYEFDKYTHAGGKLRAYLEYHKGCSLEGQFCREQAEYVSVRLGYGY